MDHGRLTDHNGKQVNFRNVILIMTTNAGAADLARQAFGFTRNKREGDDHEAINRQFAPEFRNRLDAIVSFAHLNADVIGMVVEKFVLQLEAQLADRDVTIELSEPAKAWLVQHGYDEQMGARPMARVIQEHIKKPLADEVLFGKLKGGGHVRVVLVKDEAARLRTRSASNLSKGRSRRSRRNCPARANAPCRASRNRAVRRWRIEGPGLTRPAGQGLRQAIHPKKRPARCAGFFVGWLRGSGARRFLRLDLTATMLCELADRHETARIHPTLSRWLCCFGICRSIFRARPVAFSSKIGGRGEQAATAASRLRSDRPRAQGSRIRPFLQQGHGHGISA